MANSRRQFLGQVGNSMLLAGLGSALASDLGIASGDDTAALSDTSGRLDFGALEPLVSAMQELPPDRLMAKLVAEIRSGTSLQELTAAGALANARTFGGQDYVGFHTFMALVPAFRMSQRLSAEQRALPVLKVLHRNAVCIQEFGGRSNEVLRDIHAEGAPAGVHPGEHLRKVTRSGDVERADQAYAAMSSIPIGEAFNHLQYELEDDVDVHRIVLAWRAWDTREIAGEKWGHCLLRQTVRYCATMEKRLIDGGSNRSPIRSVLPKLMDQYGLAGKSPGKRSGDDTWINELAETIFRGSREAAADAAAQAYSAGYDPELIGEAISIAANRLVLHDPGRPPEWSSAEKPAGSCHGDSIGVHASDAANAWRNIVRVSNPRNVAASLIVGAFHTAGQSGRSNASSMPSEEQAAAVIGDTPEKILSELNKSILAGDQAGAAAAALRYSRTGSGETAIFDLLLNYAVSEDGALHAEKYFHTVVSEFASTRPAFRWNQVVGLARVTASEYGRPSPGIEAAKKAWAV